MQEFRDYHQLWSDMDVATMIEALMTRRQIPQKWLGRADGERQITNLRHLTELLQQRASIAPGMHRLFKWFLREKREAHTVAAEERQLRLGKRPRSRQSRNDACGQGARSTRS
ncbi:MAG: hypothetical protein U5O39_05145 [Gammaproteobacteria bacterium]|nr:hypothetical protein [Gammaproteobacteria bacterium]